VKAAMTTMNPGDFCSGNGENEGEVDLAAADDGAASYIDIAIEETGVANQDIDTAFAAADFILSLRTSGHMPNLGQRFMVGCIMADQSADTELGEPMRVEATGHCMKVAYTDDNANLDTMYDWVGRAAEVVTDVASTDLALLIYF
jgi:hypothetical protein